MEQPLPGRVAAPDSANPVSWAITPTRDLFGDPGWQPGGEPASSRVDHAIPPAVTWPSALRAPAPPVAVRADRGPSL
jgi:ABC-2 type transport system permease protein